ncbi:glycosyltransferase [Methylocaldum marinum]|uniref:glycosyltransferase n=1 Tax=Methylocaldum marinum TaxID=1432792 RepID=UPI000E6A7C94|nr:glycosyltransferase [Methylocaldum marinum]
MKVIQVVSGIHNQAAGPSYTVPQLCKTLRQRNCQVELHTLEPLAVPDGRNDYNIQAYRRVEVPLLNRFGISPEMMSGLDRAAGSADIIHNHGLWLMPNMYAYRIAYKRRVHFVVSPRGMLSAWALNHSKWQKRLVWFWKQKQALERAACFHATAECELEEIRDLGFSAPVAVIPNGIDLSSEMRRPPSGKRRLLFLARIHKKKGVDILLNAWRYLENRYPNWELTIAGPDDGGYLSDMKQLASALQLGKVEFVGPIYGKQKENLLLSSDLYVLPTHSENFGMTVAEALAHGVPVIVTKGAPWQRVEDYRCGWWIDLSEETLITCLDNALAMEDQELRSMGDRGKTWMLQQFSWSSVAEKMERTYSWLLEGGELPAWIDL